jgi:hypothetical protein
LCIGLFNGLRKGGSTPSDAPALWNPDGGFVDRNIALCKHSSGTDGAGCAQIKFFVIPTKACFPQPSPKSLELCLFMTCCPLICSLSLRRFMPRSLRPRQTISAFVPFSGLRNTQ